VQIAAFGTPDGAQCTPNWRQKHGLRRGFFEVIVDLIKYLARLRAGWMAAPEGGRQEDGRVFARP